MNRRETFIVNKIDGDAERAARRVAMRDIALDAIAGAMREVIEPADRSQLARELCSASAMVAASACGPSSAGAHLSSLSGHVFGAAEQINKHQKRRGR
jgi:hypothetical protein